MNFIKDNLKNTQEIPNIFFLEDNHICKYNKYGKIKKYFDVEYFSKSEQEKIILVINSYYDDLTIVIKPSTNDLIFYIKNQEFIKRVWHKYEQKYYPVINDNIKL